MGTSENLFDRQARRWKTLSMKTLLTLLVFSVQILHSADAPLEKKPAGAGVEIDKKAADSMKTFTVHQFTATAEGLALTEGQIIRLKFGSRSNVYNSNGEVRCSVRDPYVNNQNDRPYLYLTIPAEGLKWFNRIPSDYYAKGVWTVIGRVIPKGQNGRELQLLGHEIQTNAKGAKVVWSK
jgi:hypothetical protein